MTKKALKALLLIGLVVLMALTAGVVMASGGKKAELPEYLGSEACLGCHTEKFTNWEATGHAHMLTEIVKPSDLPGDMNAAPEDLKAELLKADYVVAGQRFLARDPATGDLVYLKVQWSADQGKYLPYTRGGENWDQNCAGCHATGYDKSTKRATEMYIGCESCHGPGKEHILGKGDPSKIAVTTDSQVCGSCHGAGNMKDGTRWPVGYRPGMKLGELLDLPVVDPHEVPPGPEKHWRQYPLWAASAHATAVTSLESSDHTGNYCYKCHAAEAFKDEMINGKAFDPKQHAAYSAVSCVACHDPHNSAEQAQLRMPADQLCIACHNGSIPEGGTVKAGTEVHHPMKEMLTGYGAIGIAPTKGAHSGLTCVECHMTEGNHLMKVITPEDILSLGNTTRKDSCTACHAHANSTPESRAVYLELWTESVTTRLEAIKGDVAYVDAKLKANTNGLTGDALAKYQAAKTNASFVEADASKGAHNFEYAIKILTAAQKEITAARAAVK